ncbi:hypothetical protein [Burkholderia sp. L27(2015)]|uniref:hypothetical protein n=1 Tax=Burkholderia sp. L27(2015) TaxID=1641858 RepID=UPI00131DEC27|nr:hypothetical protein [Burkholderia sp. L27(2015)]
MKSKSTWASLDAYMQLWGGPFLMLGGMLAVGTALYIYLLGRYEIEYRDQTPHHAVTTLEDVRLPRPGTKQRFNYTRLFIFKIEGQEVEFPGPFEASPGEPIAVDYIIGASGKVHVTDVGH